MSSIFSPGESAAPTSSDDYRSSFGNWEARASVRNAPLRMVDEQSGGKLFFPPELVPVVRHPLVSARGEEFMRRVLLHRLYAYLHFTAELEQLVVNPVTQLLSRRRLGFDLPDRMVHDAYRICTDESWHAQFTDDLQRQLEAATADPPGDLPRPFFLRELERLRLAEDSDTRGLTRIFFTVVSETLISAILTEIPRDMRLLSAVRETVADHAQDEGRHHAFYSQFFDRAWHQLGTRQRRTVGLMLPTFVTAFLAPDATAQSRLLRLADFSDDEVRGILDEAHPPAGIARTVRAAAQPTLRMFHRNGVLDDARVHDEFARYGLVG